MRILFATYAERTHYLEMVPLGWALHNAGHEVRVASQPELIDTISASGLTAVSVGRDSGFRRVMRARARAGSAAGPVYDEPDSGTDEAAWVRVREHYDHVVPWWWRLVNEPMVEDLTLLCQQWRPDLVVWDGVTFAGAIAAEASGAAHGRFMFGLDVFARLRGRFHRLRVDRPESGDEADVLGRWLARLGARVGVRFSERLVTGQFTIDHVPPSLRLDTGVPLDRVTMRFVPYNGRAVVPSWLRTPPGRPRVCLSLGMSAVENGTGFPIRAQGLLEALADLDVEVVATFPESVQVGLRHVPANARVVEFAPLDPLVSTCAAIIDHGGTGTLCTAAAHGVPQLVVPQTFDEPILARKLTECGAGLALSAGTADGPAVRERVVRLLDDPEFGFAAARLRGEMRAMPGPDAVVAELEHRVAARQGPDHPAVLTAARAQ